MVEVKAEGIHVADGPRHCNKQRAQADFLQHEHSTRRAVVVTWRAIFEIVISNLLGNEQTENVSSKAAKL